MHCHVHLSARYKYIYCICIVYDLTLLVTLHALLCVFTIEHGVYLKGRKPDWPNSVWGIA